MGCPAGGCGGDREARGRGKHRLRAGSTKDAGPGRAGRGLRRRSAHTKAASGRARYSQGERALSMPAARGSGRARRARPRSRAGVRSQGRVALGRGPRRGGGRQAALLLRAAPSGRAAAGPRSRVLLPAPRASAPAPAPTKSAGRAGLPFVPPPPRPAHGAGPDTPTWLRLSAATCGMLPMASTCGSYPRQVPGPRDLWKLSAELWAFRDPIFPGGDRPQAL